MYTDLEIQNLVVTFIPVIAIRIERRIKRTIIRHCVTVRRKNILWVYPLVLSKLDMQPYRKNRLSLACSAFVQYQFDLTCSWEEKIYCKRQTAPSVIINEVC